MKFFLKYLQRFKKNIKKKVLETFINYLSHNNNY